MMRVMLVGCVMAAMLSGCGKSRQEHEAEFAAKEGARQAAAAASEAAAQAKADEDERRKSEAREAVAKARLLGALERKLKDPGSVQYRGVKVRIGKMSDNTGRKGDSACGEFNAKNSFGGYGGFSTFWVYAMDGEEPTVWTTDSGEPIATLARNGAREMGCGSAGG